MASALRPLLLASFVCGVTALLAPGCSQQGEGERCDKVKAQNSDCDSGLVCIPKAQLLDESSDRCCPATPGDESDERCRRGSGKGNGEGGSPDPGEQPSEGGAAGEPSGGGAGGMSSMFDGGGNGGAAEEPTGSAGAAGAAPSPAGGAPQAAGGAAGAGGA